MLSDVYLLEVDGYTDTSTYETHRYSMRGAEGYRTRPTDTPPNTWYRDRVVSIGAMTREMPSATGAGSRGDWSSEVGFGNAVLANIDGGLDALFGSPATISFRERQFRVLRLPAGAPYSDAEVVLRCVISQAELSRERVTLHLKDRLYELDSPHLTATFAGNNALPNGLEGGPELTGKIKPLVIGKVFQVEPPCVNTSRLIYQISSAALYSVDAVYDGRVVLTAGAAYSSQSDMETNAPSAGQYRVWLAGGMIRLGSSPAFTITVDASGHSAANSTAAQLIKALALARGFDPVDISSADITALDTANSAVLGRWINDSSTTRQIIDILAGSVGTHVGPDRLGVLRMSRLELPTGSPVAVLAQWNEESLDSMTDGGDVPVTTVRLKYARYYSVQSGNQIAGSVSEADRADYAQEWRTAEATSTPSPNPHKRTNTIERETAFAYEADAQAEAARLITLYGTPRRSHVMKGVQLDADTLLSLDINAVVELRWNRYGFSREAGALRRVIAITKDITAGKADLTVWGD